MAFDCYCAICGVGFCGMQIETPSEASSERRRRWIEQRYRAQRAGISIDQVPHGNEEAVRSYDPKIVTRDNVAWLSKAHCLGSKTNAAGTEKASILGQGYYADEGEFAVTSAAGDRSMHTCYGSGTEETPGPVIPFHWCCFEILTRVLTGTTNTENVDMDVLYSVMSDLSNYSSSALSLNYGDDVQRSQGRYWQCSPGTEYCTTHPTETPRLDEFIQNDMINSKKFKIPSAEFKLEERCLESPFGKLPLEIVYHICSFLPGQSMKALTEASLSLRILTEHNWFWKRFIQMDMPWFWEFSQNQEHLPEDLNYRLLYLWLDKMTAPRYGIRDLALIGVANRRRIWGVCEELAAYYTKSLNRASGTIKQGA